MKKTIHILLLLCLVSSASFAKKNKTQEVDSLGNPIKTGWNFGLLPSVGYDADYGFQGGLLTNIYYYGDGHQYPEYIHSIYAEAAYTTKQHGLFRLNYDSKYLIPNHRLTIDASYLPDAMCDFYGFNGYQSIYHSSYHTWYNERKYNKLTPANQELFRNEYQSRLFYKNKRDLIRLAVDMEGTIYKGLKWNAGIGVLGYIMNDCDVNMLNGKKKGVPITFDANKGRWEQKTLDPQVEGLFQKYKQWGLIEQSEENGGWHPYARAGLTYDTRDKRQGPTSGLYVDGFFTYNAAFNAQYGQQAEAGYNNLQFNFAFRHYISLGNPRYVFAYRVGTQNLIAGKTPFYMNSYLNTSFIQRVLYEGLGGGNSLRGVLVNRINADGFLFANVEFRLRVANFDIGRQHFFFGLNPFFDMGMVTQAHKATEIEELVQTTPSAAPYFSSTKSDIYRPHMSAGLGIKIGMNENFVLSVDWAMPVNEKYYIQQDNPKWANFYVKMGYLF